MKGGPHGVKGGRPRKDRHLEDFEELGKPPRHPLQLSRWIQRALAIDAWRMMTGRSDDNLSQNLRATATAMAKTLPADIIEEAMRLLRDDQAQLSGDADPAVESLEGDDGEGLTLAARREGGG